MSVSKSSYMFISESSAVEEVIQVVLIVDLMDDKFKPINSQVPSVLLPVIDKPAIDYTLRALVSIGFRNIMIVLSRHISQVKKYIMESKIYREKEAAIEFLCVPAYQCFTLGDVLRELYSDVTLHLRGEFVVINGLMMARVNLKSLVDRHLIRRINDDRVVLTVLFHNFPVYDEEKDDDKGKYVMVVDSTKNEILQIESCELEHINFIKKYTRGRNGIDIISDLKHTGIYFFDIRGVALFSDNFDFSTVDDFLRVIIGDEVLQRAVCYDIINDYIEIMGDLGHYYDVCFDVLQQWSYPDSPDLRGYTLKSSLYLGLGIDVCRSCNLTGWTSIGHNSVVKSRSTITQSIIGDNCAIGENVTILNSILWNNVKVESNSVIDNSIICTGASILSKTSVSNGCIIGFGIVVGPNVIIPEKTIVFKNFEQNNPFTMSDIIDLGTQSNGSIYEIDKLEWDMYNWGLSGVKSHGIILESPTVAVSSQGDSDSDDDDSCDFLGSVRESMSHGFKRGVDTDTIITEIIALKSTFSVNIQALQSVARESLVSFCIPKKMENNEDIMTHIKKFSDCFGPFCTKFFSTNEQLVLLMKLFEDSMYDRASLHSLYSRLMIVLFISKVINYDFLLRWKDFESEQWDPQRKAFRMEKIQQSLNYLEKIMNQMESDEDTETESDTDTTED